MKKVQRHLHNSQEKWINEFIHEEPVETYQKTLN